MTHPREEPCAIVELKSYICLRNAFIDSTDDQAEVYLSEKGGIAGFLHRTDLAEHLKNLYPYREEAKPWRTDLELL